MAEKQLLNLTDVFANVANVLLFDGKERIQPEDLVDVLPRSTYTADGKLREQERDVAKIWKRCKIRIALLGLENQTDIDRRMPLRIIGYDGAAYRNELNVDDSELYPVITLVLYFGYEKRWEKPKSLRDCFDVPEELAKYFSDYRINVVEIAWLPDEIIAKFGSSFRVVAEYFSQLRKGENRYHPSIQVVRHAKEVLDLLGLLTKDVRFEEAKEYVRKGEVVNMGAILLDRMEAKAKAEGMAKGIAERTMRTIRNQLKRHEDYKIIASDNDTTVEEVARIAKESGLAY